MLLGEGDTGPYMVLSSPTSTEAITVVFRLFRRAKNYLDQLMFQLVGGEGQEEQQDVSWYEMLTCSRQICGVLAKS